MSKYGCKDNANRDKYKIIGLCFTSLFANIYAFVKLVTKVESKTSYWS